MRLALVALLGGLLAASSAVLPGVCARAATDPVVDRVSPILDRDYEVRASQDFSAVGPHGSPSAEQLSDLLDKAVEMLSASDAPNLRDQLKGTFAEISKTQKQIADYRVDMASAPDGEPSLLRSAVKEWFGISVGTPTKGDYQQMIADCEADLHADQGHVDAAKKAFADQLRASGIELTDDQIDGLLTMATAQDFLAMETAFRNMKSINQSLLQATIRSDESLEVAKRYYGIYTVMLEIAMEMHEDFLWKIDHRYLKRLQAIMDKTQAVRDQAVRMRRAESDPNLAKILAANVASQDLTLRTAELYRQLLVDQRSKVQASFDVVSHQHDVAVNTYKTVGLSDDLVTLVRSTGKQFDEIMKIDVPPLRPFESVEMKQEFEKLTTEIKSQKNG